VGDLTAVLAVKSSAQKAGALQAGGWVRLKRLPKYRGDIARVVAITQGGAAAIVQMEPVTACVSLYLHTCAGVVECLCMRVMEDET